MVSCQLHFSKHLLLRTTSLLSPAGGIGRFFRTYIIAGDPTLALAYLNWLVFVDEGQDMTDYCFPSKKNHLEGHTTTGEPVVVDTRTCMEYLIEGEGTDPKKVLNDPLIKDHKNLLWQMAAADPPVDLFDATTWSNVDYKPLYDMVHAVIAPRMCQNQ